MAKGQKATQQSVIDAQTRAIDTNTAAVKALSAPTPGQARQEARSEAVEGYVAKKDYRTPAPGMISLNFSDPAQRARMRERLANITPEGATAFGAADANPTALALSHEHMMNQDDLDAASAYESNLGNYVDSVRNADLPYSQIQTAREGTLYSGSNNAVLGLTQQRIESTPKPILPGLLAAGIGAAGMFLGGPAFGAGGVFNHG